MGRPRTLSGQPGQIAVGWRARAPLAEPVGVAQTHAMSVVFLHGMPETPRVWGPLDPDVGVTRHTAVAGAAGFLGRIWTSIDN